MTDIFAGGDTPVVDQTKDYLSELVGEDKKFKTPQDLARGKAESDAFIKKIADENAELRKELGTRLKMDEFLTKLETTIKAPSNENNQTREPVAVAPVQPPNLEAVIEQKLNEAEALRRANGNVSIVVTKLKELYGENYASKVKTIASNLGLGEDFLNSVAAKSPQAFFQLIGTPAKEKEISTPTSSATSFRPNTGDVRNSSYYKSVRNKMGNAAFFADMTLQKQVFEDMKNLGPEEFNK